jgi:PAS domain S-box-containing protein
MTQPTSTFGTSSTHATRWWQILPFTASATLRQLLILASVLLALIWGGVIWQADRIKTERVADFRQNLMHLSEVLDETLVRQLQEIDNALLILRSDYIDNKPNLKRTVRLLWQGPLKNLDVHVTIINRLGYAEMSDASESVSNVYLGDRAHFRYFADGGADQLYISDPVLGRITKRWGMQLVRPILDHNGKFLGAIVIFLPPEQLTHFMQALEVGSDTVMTVFSPTGVMLSRSKDIDTLLGSRQSPQQLADFQRDKNGFLLRRSALDQVERGIAFRWIKPYPLLLLVARTPTGVYAEIAASQRLLMFLGGAVSLVVSGTLVLLGNSFRRRERAEALLLRERSHLIEAQRISQLGSWALDRASKRLVWSDEVFRIFEMDPTQLPPSYEAFLNAVHPDDRSAVMQAHTDARNKLTPLDIVHRLRMADGRVKWVREQGTSDLDAHGKFLRSTGTLQDITERRHAELELRIAEVAFQTQEGMFVTDENGVILRINNAFTDITGYTTADVLGKNPSLRSSGRHDAAFFVEMWARLRSTGAWKGEIWNRHKNGDIRPEAVTITAVRGEDEKVTHYVATVHDITERMAAVEQIKSLAFLDPLTRLPNRRLLHDRLNQALLAMLQQVAQRLLGCVREADTVARLGGDEFVVMLDQLSASSPQAVLQTEAVGEKVLAALNQAFDLEGHQHHSSASIGVTLYCGQPDSTDELLKQADRAMYQAKAAGRNTLRFFAPDMALAAADQAKPQAA